MQRRLIPLLLEELEDRNCPSLTAQFVAGSLYLSGTPIAVGSAGQSLNITRTVGTTYQVVDGGHFIGNYNITGSLYLNLTRFASDINVNLNGGTTPATAGVFPGNVYLNLGIGNTDFFGGFLDPHSVNISGGSAAGDLGVVNGTVYFLKGDGQETFNIGTLGDDQTMSAPVTVKGTRSCPGLVWAVP